MAKCIKCGNNIADDTNVCPYCGHTKTIHSKKKSRQTEECPCCGAPISDIDAVCPYCQSEINRPEAQGSLQRLIEELNQADSYGNRAYARKLNLIENYQVPNDRSEILDFLYLALDRLTALSRENNNSLTLQKSKLWYSKAQAAVEKARIVMPHERIPDEIFLQIRQRMKIVIIRKYAVWGIIALLMALYVFTSIIKNLFS